MVVGGVWEWSTVLVHNSKLMKFQLEEVGGCAAAWLSFSSSFNTMYLPLQFVLEEWRCEAAGRDVSFELPSPFYSAFDVHRNCSVHTARKSRGSQMHPCQRHSVTGKRKAKGKGSVHCVGQS